MLYGCAEEWNKLDVKTRGITDLGEFKKKQKEWLKSTIGNNSDSQWTLITVLCVHLIGNFKSDHDCNTDSTIIILSMVTLSSVYCH